MIIPELDANKAKEHLDTGETVFIDVRQQEFFVEGHIPGAFLLSDDQIDVFVEKFDKDKTLVLYCYAGNFSRGGVQYLLNRGFKKVYTLWGGFEHWTETHPDVVEQGEPEPIPGL